MARVVARSRVAMPVLAPLLLLGTGLAAAGIWLWTGGRPDYGAPVFVASLLPAPFVLAARRSVRVTESGVEERVLFGKRAIPWAEISGLGAVARGDQIRFVAYVSTGPDVEFGGDWTGASEVAGSIQARGPRPGASVDRQAALADPPRGEVGAKLGAPPDVLERLYAHLQGALAERGIQRFDRKRLQAFGDSQVYELFGVCRRVLREPEARWPELLRDHFQRVDALRFAAAELTANPPTYESVRARLRLQVHRDGPDLPLGSGLGLVLVLRDANGEISVPPELIERWAVGRDEVIQRARENLLSLHLPVQRDQVGITAWSGEYAAAQVAVLDQRVEIDPELGALVAFPGQEVLVAVPIADEATLGALLAGKFARFLDEVIGRTTSPLSGALYWWDQGRIVEIPVERTETGPRHWLPEELAQRLAARFGGSGVGGFGG